MVRAETRRPICAERQQEWNLDFSAIRLLEQMLNRLVVTSSAIVSFRRFSQMMFKVEDIVYFTAGY
jgi:hypothetical protein